LPIILIFTVASCSSDIFNKSGPESDTKSNSEVTTESITQSPEQIVKNEPKNIETPTKLQVSNSQKVQQYCDKLDNYFEKYNWGQSHCNEFSWHHVRDSYLGNPIVWSVFGNEEEHKLKHKNATLIFCGVHGDEITPVKFCFDVLHDLAQNPQSVGKDNIVIIAPLVAPDSFLKNTPTRFNARGVDVNRNFPTNDWNKNALKLWKSRYKSDKRRYPGDFAHSEHETVFQINLIKRYNPDKIISVHAPLTLIDYDGPEEENNGNNAKQLLIQMSDKAGKYRINNYPFFTGSLGNWAGNERGIPTYTLELPNSDWTKTKIFYNTFKTAIHHAIEHDLKSDLTPKKKVSKKSEKNEPVL